MLDLKTVKEIRISEGSVKKITNSSGVVLWQKVVAPSASLDVDLNNQWVFSTKKLDGYIVYMSNSNKGVNNGYASMKFKFKGMPDFKLWINSYAESSYDYTVAWNLDVDYPTRNPSNGSTGVKAHTKSHQKDPTTIDNFTEVDYANDGGEHFVVVTYRKNNRRNTNDDRGYVAVKLTLISTTWVVSSTEFVKKDNKYYQRINEVGTYEGGVTGNTGNYKEGNELTVTYHQGSADDYMVVGSGRYYKIYIYVKPKDQELNTGDYIQGDYIGEATPSMKVTYTDNTEKTFYELTSIKSDTDSNKENAKNVEIYDGVTKIGQYAFQNCTNLTAITIPSGVTSIGQYAFQNCSSLTGITIPSGVTSIGSYAFNACSSLTAITIPSGVTSIDYAAFRDCTSLTAITIPSGVTSIGNAVFQNCTSLTAITIPSGVTSISQYAFANCTSLTAITIPSGVTSIDYAAFKGCSSLTGLTIPSGVTRIGDFAFEKCSNLSSVTIPSGVTSIDYNAFQNCSSLTGVTIENSSSKLAYNNNAFDGISSSAKLYVPSNLLSEYQADSDWSGAFGGGIYAIGTIPAMKVTYTDGTTKYFANLTSIEQNTDSNKYRAKNVEIYDGVTSIGEQTFMDCKSLTGITIPNSVTIIGNYAFYNCSSLTSITIPNSVTIIGNYAFYGCSSFTGITIPSGVTSIGNGAFMNCSSLTGITIPSGVTRIGDNAFKGCSSLTGLTIPSGVTRIDTFTFNGCSSLSSITIPANVTYISSYAFENCSKLESVTIQNSSSKLDYEYHAFAGISSSAKLYVPSNLLSEYQADSDWSDAFGGGIYAIPS